MTSARNFLFIMAVVVVVGLIALTALMPASYDVSAAPAPAITPVAIEDPLGSSDVVLVKFYDGEVLAADDQECRDLSEYRVIDLEYVVDQTTTNTTTVTLEHTNGAGATNAVNTTGQTVVSANAADADDLNRFDLFGVYTCVDINVTNTNPITWTVYALARK